MAKGPSAEPSPRWGLFFTYKLTVVDELLLLLEEDAIEPSPDHEHGS